MYAVIDIGKTNKKVVLYDDAMRLVSIRKREIETILVEGFDVEDVETAIQWFLEQLGELASLHTIEGIAITTHGASLVCLDKDGQPSVPPVAYTNEVDDGVHQGFWAAMGDPKEVQRQSATTEIKPLVNNAKLLWFLKERWA